jgi:predicted XRE-type DNA-binding protein
MSAKKAVKKTTAAHTKIKRRLSATRARGRVGSSFDDFLRETGDYETVKSKAIKRVLAWQISEAMREDGLTKAEMAKRMSTSRSQLDRLLDPANDDVTLSTLARAAEALGREIKLELA